ncbi:MAG: hypothetical protein QG555_319 [Thermodesulfobacteriota bacterium]|nr:hypothetical protein [Thermodesulfobacteriota bacterium]
MVDVAAGYTGTWLQYGFLFHLGKMELQKDEIIDLGNNDVEAESLTMTKYSGAGYKINRGYTFSVRDGLRLLKGKLEVNGTFDLQGVYDSTMDGVLAGTGTFLKSGPGTLTINGDGTTFTGETSLSRGQINIGANGKLGGKTYVSAGTILAGTGQIGALHNHGQVKPGNGSVGTLKMTQCGASPAADYTLYPGQRRHLNGCRRHAHEQQPVAGPGQCDPGWDVGNLMAGECDSPQQNGIRGDYFRRRRCFREVRRSPRQQNFPDVIFPAPV